MSSSPVKVWARLAQAQVDVAPAERPRVPLEAVGGDRVVHADQGGQRLVVDLDRLGPPPRGLGVSPSTQHTAWP